MVTGHDSVNSFFNLYCLLMIQEDTPKLTSFDRDQQTGSICGTQIYHVRLVT